MNIVSQIFSPEFYRKLIKNVNYSQIRQIKYMLTFKCCSMQIVENFHRYKYISIPNDLRRYMVSKQIFIQIR